MVPEIFHTAYPRDDHQAVDESGITAEYLLATMIVLGRRGGEFVNALLDNVLEWKEELDGGDVGA